jgi:hypothetical protein
LHHISAEGVYVQGLQIPAVGIKEGHDVEGRHLCIEGFGILEVLVPNLIDHFVEKLGNPTLSRFIAGIVIKARLVGCLSANAEDRGGIAGKVLVIEGQAGRAYKLLVAVIVFVPGSLPRTCKYTQELGGAAGPVAV